MYTESSSQNDIKEDSHSFWFHSSPPTGRLGAPSQEFPTSLSHRSSKDILSLGHSRNFGGEELVPFSQKTATLSQDNQTSPHQDLQEIPNTCNPSTPTSLSPSSTSLHGFQGHKQSHSQIQRSRRSKDANERRAAQRIAHRQERRVQYRQWRTALKSRTHKQAGRAKDTCMPKHTHSPHMA